MTTLRETLKLVDCPRCHGDWYMDLEPETGRPYTCFCCGNGTYKFIEVNGQVIVAPPRRSELDDQ